MSTMNEKYGDCNCEKLSVEEYDDIYADLLSISGLKDRVWAHFNELKKSGVIN